MMMSVFSYILRYSPILFNHRFLPLVVLLVTVFFGNIGGSAMSLALGSTICQIVSSFYLLFHLCKNPKSNSGNIPLTWIDIVVIASFLLFSFSVACQNPKYILGNEVFMMHLSLFFLYYGLRDFTYPEYRVAIKMSFFVIGVLSILYTAADVVYVNNSFVELNISTFGPFGNANIFAGVMAIIAPVIFSLKDESQISKKWKLAAKTIVVLLLASIFFYSSRGAIVAVLVMLIWVMVQKISKKNIWVTFSIFAIFAVTLGRLLFQKEQSSLGRYNILKLTFDIFRDKVFTGIGYGRFDLVYNNFQTSYFLKGYGSEQQKFLANIIHYPLNEYVHLSLEFGLAGILIIAIFLVLIFARPKLSKSERYFFCSMIGFLTFSLFSFSLRIWFTGLLFLILTVVLNAESASNVNFRIPNVLKALLNKGFVFLAALLLIYSLFQLTLVIKWQNADDLSVEDQKSAIVLYTNLYPNMRGNGRFLLHYGKVLHDSGNNRRSIDVLKESTYLFTSLEAFLLIADNYDKLMMPDAEKYFQYSCYLVPSKLFPKYYLMNYYLRNHQMSKAKRVAKEIISGRVKIESAESSAIMTAASNVYYLK